KSRYKRIDCSTNSLLRQCHSPSYDVTVVTRRASQTSPKGAAAVLRRAPQSSPGGGRSLRSEGVEQPVAHDVDEFCGHCGGASAGAARTGLGPGARLASLLAAGPPAPVAAEFAAESPAQSA